MCGSVGALAVEILESCELDHIPERSSRISLSRLLRRLLICRSTSLVPSPSVTVVLFGSASDRYSRSIKSRNCEDDDVKSVERRMEADHRSGCDLLHFWARFLLGSPQIVSSLHGKPHFGCGAEGDGKAQSHVRADAGASVEYGRQGLPGHAKTGGGLAHGHALREVFSKDLAGMGGVMHTRHSGTVY